MEAEGYRTRCFSHSKVVAQPNTLHLTASGGANLLLLPDNERNSGRARKSSDFEDHLYGGASPGPRR